MKTTRLLILSLLSITGIANAQIPASPDAAPEPATEPAQTEMQKWIATTDAQWQAVFNREVTDVHAAELKDLALKYAAALDAGIAKVSAAGDLKGAVVLRDEKKRFADTNVFPEKDEDGDEASVKVIRAAIRVQFAKLETANAARVKAVHARYDAVLAQAQMQLTQRQRIDDALLVKAKRDEVAAAWNVPASAAPTPPTLKSNPVVGAKVKPEIPAAPALVIISAIYGELSTNHTINVKATILKAMNGGATDIRLSREEAGGGIDPARFRHKQTIITYTINGEHKKKTFDENYKLNFKKDLN